MMIFGSFSQKIHQTVFESSCFSHKSSTDSTNIPNTSLIFENPVPVVTNEEDEENSQQDDAIPEALIPEADPDSIPEQAEESIESQIIPSKDDLSLSS